MRHQKKVKSPKVSKWLAIDGVKVSPDKNGRWPAVQVITDKNGKKRTIIAGGTIANHHDAI